MTIAQRIAELREYARADGDRCNESSIADVLAFPQLTGMDGPYLFMEENGDMRALFRNAKMRFGLDFYGQGKARLFRSSPYLNRPEIHYFSLAGIPAELTEESFLTFVKEHAYDPSEEVVV